MNYKTITLRLLEDRPELYEQLRQRRLLLQTLDDCAWTLKTSHEAWRETLSRLRPESDPRQLASEALELAIQNLAVCLSHGLITDERDIPSLDEAMTYLRPPTVSV